MSLVWNSHLIRCPVFYLKPNRKNIPQSACPLLISAPFTTHITGLSSALVLASNSCKLHNNLFKKPCPLIGRENFIICKVLFNLLFADLEKEHISQLFPRMTCHFSSYLALNPRTLNIVGGAFPYLEAPPFREELFNCKNSCQTHEEVAVSCWDKWETDFNKVSTDFISLYIWHYILTKKSLKQYIKMCP